MDAPPPRTIGRYEVRREIGRGTMGVVYEARDPALGRTIALKTIELAFVVDREDLAVFEKRFFAEARIAARLSHPGIVVVHDVGRDEATGTLYIALEHLEGRTLAEVRHAGVPREWREVLHIVREVAEALHHAHTEGVVHRDIKPANIMLLPNGQPKVMDFGIAKIETARLKLTATGQFFGTPLYMAPEQALARKVDGRADVFSLGAIAYALLTGKDAFAAANLTKIIARVVHEDPPPPSHVARTLSPEIDDLVMRALAKDPGDRYPSALALAEDAEDILAGRAPRHRAGWTRPPVASGTLVSAPAGVEDLEGELSLHAQAEVEPGDLLDDLAALVPEVPPGKPASQRPGTQPGRIAAPAPAPVSRPSRAQAPRAARLGAGSLIILLLGGGALMVVRATRQPEPSPSPDRALPSSTIVSAPMAPRAAASPAPADPAAPPAPTPEAKAPPREAKPAARPTTAPAARAKLALDVEHPLKSGTLRVWIDERLALQESLRGHVTKDVVAFKIRKGSLGRTLNVAPGRREIRVAVTWDDNLKEEKIAGTFEAGGTHVLEVRLGRLRKDLTLEWK